MKSISTNQYFYKGYNIFIFKHPQLFGKYEIYLGNTFIKRVRTLTEAKKEINSEVFELPSKEDVYSVAIGNQMKITI